MAFEMFRATVPDAEAEQVACEVTQTVEDVGDRRAAVLGEKLQALKNAHQRRINRRNAGALFVAGTLAIACSPNDKENVAKKSPAVEDMDVSTQVVSQSGSTIPKNLQLKTLQTEGWTPPEQDLFPVGGSVEMNPPIAESSAFFQSEEHAFIKERVEEKMKEFGLEYPQAMRDLARQLGISDPADLLDESRVPKGAVLDKLDNDYSKYAYTIGGKKIELYVPAEGDSWNHRIIYIPDASGNIVKMMVQQYGEGDIDVKIIDAKGDFIMHKDEVSYSREKVANGETQAEHYNSLLDKSSEISIALQGTFYPIAEARNGSAITSYTLSGNAQSGYAGEFRYMGFIPDETAENGRRKAVISSDISITLVPNSGEDDQERVTYRIVAGGKVMMVQDIGYGNYGYVGGSGTIPMPVLSDLIGCRFSKE